MAIFAFKPTLVDFGHEPSIKVVQFVHQCSSIVITDKPSWIETAEISFNPYTSAPSRPGKITLEVGYDVAEPQLGGIITVLCNGTDEFYIPCVYSFDSVNIPILDVIDNSLFSQGQLSYVGPRDRPRAILAATRWLQDNSGASGTNVRVGEIVNDDGFAYMPSDFVDLIAAYSVSEDGFLLPLYVNNNINTASGPVADDNGYYMLDDNGYVVAASGLTPRVDDSNGYTVYGANIPSLVGTPKIQYRIKPGLISVNGAYKFDRNNRRLETTGVSGNIVIEYRCDPLLRYKMKHEYGKLMVHKSYQEVLEAFIYYALIEKNATVSYTEKRRAKREYVLAYKRARLKSLNLNEIIQALRG